MASSADPELDRAARRREQNRIAQRNHRKRKQMAQFSQKQNDQQQQQQHGDQQQWKPSLDMHELKPQTTMRFLLKEQKLEEEAYIAFPRESKDISYGNYSIHSPHADHLTSYETPIDDSPFNSYSEASYLGSMEIAGSKEFNGMMTSLRNQENQARRSTDRSPCQSGDAPPNILLKSSPFLNPSASPSPRGSCPQTYAAVEHSYPQVLELPVEFSRGDDCSLDSIPPGSVDHSILSGLHYHYLGHEQDASRSHSHPPAPVCQSNSFITISENEDNAGRTYLHMAAAQGSSALVRCLLSQGMRTDTRDNDGFTALHHAIRGGHLNTVNELLRGGADLEVRDSLGRTALHFAIDEEQGDIAVLLVHMGANIHGTTIRQDIVLNKTNNERQDAKIY